MEKFIFNKDIAVLMENKKDLKDVFIANTVQLNNYTARRSSIKGQDYLVVPVTMIVEGVLNRIRYTKDEMFESYSFWNNRPAVLNHPADGFSANRREILEDFGLGMILNTQFDMDEQEKGLLVAEAWFNISETQRIAPDVFERLEAGDPIEVSTGLVIDIHRVDNSYYEGELFEYLATNYKPDHLAILPKDLGACSISDGCGIRQNMEQENNEEGNYKENEMKLQEMIDKLAEKTALNAEELGKMSEEAINTLFADYKLNEEVEEEAEVEKEVVAEEVVAEVEAEVEKEEVVAEVEAEEKAEVEVETNEEVEAEAEVEEAEEEVIAEEEIEAEVETNEEVEAEVEEVEAEVEAEEEVAVEAEVETKEQENKKEVVINTAEELFSSMKIAPELMENIKAGIASFNKDKEILIDEIVEAKEDVYTKEELNSKSMDELQKLAKLASGADYSISNAAPAKDAKKAGLARPAFTTNEGDK